MNQFEKPFGNDNHPKTHTGETNPAKWIENCTTVRSLAHNLEETAARASAETDASKQLELSVAMVRLIVELESAAREPVAGSGEFIQ
jgi:hypothetical protein